MAVAGIQNDTSVTMETKIKVVQRTLGKRSHEVTLCMGSIGYDMNKVVETYHATSFSLMTFG